MIHSIKFHKWTPTREPTGRCHVHNIILSHFSYGNCLNVSNFKCQFDSELSFNILTNIEKVKVNFAPFSLPKQLKKILHINQLVKKCGLIRVGLLQLCSTSWGLVKDVYAYKKLNKISR